MFQKSALSMAVLATTLGLAACGGGSDSLPPQAQAPATPPGLARAPAVLGNTVALTATNALISFNRAAPRDITSRSPAITGLQAGETLVGIDYRPANGLLYGVGTSGAVYELNPLTGAASNRIALTSAAAGNAAIVLDSNASFGVDFNPQADRLRVVSSTGQNLRINVGAAVGNTFVDTPIASSNRVSGSAYTNAFSGTVNTDLYSINLATNTLDEQGTLNAATGTTQPNDGTQTTGAPLGVAPTAVNGFDIDARNNVGFAAFTVGATTTLYTLNINAVAPAAAATAVGAIGDGTEGIRGLTLAPIAAPTVTALTSTNGLVTFSPRTPNTVSAVVPITGGGMVSGETVLGMDFRPQDGLLWALSSAGRIYTIVPSTGVATFRVALPQQTTTALAGSTSLSVDFNPVANRMRVITPSGLNLRIAVVDIPASGTTAAVPAGTTATDTMINRATGSAPTVLAAAYTNNFVGGSTPASTQLFDLEGADDFLTLQNPPNDGTLTNRGTAGLSVNITGFTGFDIAGGQNGLILAALRANDTGPFQLRTINLTNGVSSLYNPVATGTAPTEAQSQIGGANGPVIRDIAINPL